MSGQLLKGEKLISVPCVGFKGGQMQFNMPAGVVYNPRRVLESSFVAGDYTVINTKNGDSKTGTFAFPAAITKMEINSRFEAKKIKLRRRREAKK